MSFHVGDRYYRAPEIMMLQKQYDSAADIWSLGLSMIEAVHGAFPKPNFPKYYQGNVGDYFRRLDADDIKVFRGRAQHPLSPRKPRTFQDGSIEKQVIPGVFLDDQLALVLDDLDAPLDDSELSFLANEEDRKYITGLQERLMIRKDGNLKDKDPCLKVI